MRVQFNKPYATGLELGYIQQALELNYLSGDGFFSKQCQAWLENTIGCNRALLTSSCTDALEMAAILLNLQEGDEVIMPSFTFVSTANAMVMRRAVPVFVDIRPDTLNIDENLIEQAITPKTRAIVVVHYAGVGCEMDRIMQIAAAHNLTVIEDAAHATLAKYRGRQLGSIAELATLSFHETKNIICGEGGALIVNHPQYRERAEIIREKGTNRSKFFRGEVDKYTWVDIGSSFLPSELQAAFLWAQLEAASRIISDRIHSWNQYHAKLEHLELAGLLQRPVVPPHCEPNGHMYYIVTRSSEERQLLTAHLGALGIDATFHYIPLHSSPAGKIFAKTSGSLAVTDRISECLLRIPLWVGLNNHEIDYVTQSIAQFYRGRSTNPTAWNLATTFNG